MRAPPSLRHEHGEIHHELDRATRASGRLGAAARRVARILHSHFEREEEYATPPLALLRDLARDRITQDMAAVVPLVERLEAELPLMLEEHQAIVGALEGLKRVATEEGAPEFIALAERLELHAQTEEEILYPAAVLVGKYVKLKLKG